MKRTLDFLCAFIPFLTLVCVSIIATLAVMNYNPGILGIQTPEQAAPVDEKPIAGVDPDLVIGISEILVHEHERFEAADTAFNQLRAEATQVVNTLIGEINRLKSRPTLSPATETADKPTPADTNG